MNFGPVYILGVTAGNTSQNSRWDVFKIYAGVDMKAIAVTNITCCLRYKYEKRVHYLKASILQTKLHFMKAPLRTVHLTCHNLKHISGMVPDGVGLTVATSTCHENQVQYVKPSFPYEENDAKVVLGTQVAYANISAELIIEWMETYKYLGVDKVITYYIKDLNENARKVLEYYSKSGILDLYYHELAGSDHYSHNLLKKSGQQFNDLRLVIYDTFERMFGFKYLGIIDYDEFLIPSRNRSLKQMLVDLFDTYPKAAGFVFKIQYYYLSWGASGKGGDLLLEKYVNTTASSPKLDRPKNLYIPKYIEAVRVHYPTPVKGKIIKQAPVEDGFIRHFRKCRDKRQSLPECFSTERKTDVSVSEWSACIKDNVHKVRKRVFGTELPLD